MGYIKKWYIALVAVGVILLLVVTFLFQALTIYTCEAVVKEAGSAIGIAPFTDRIDFGDVPQGATVGRTIVLENAGAVPNSVHIFILGGIGDLVKVQPGSVTLVPGETAEVDFVLTMPESAKPERQYFGRVFLLRLPMGVW